MKLKILSEGTGGTTKVVNAETGEEVENIISLDFSMTAFNVDAAIVIRDPHLSIDNLDTREIRQGDSLSHDGTASDPDNQQYSEQAGLEI
tara:strand:- start:9496 stop:9765 length:270 start_codon:yes stop_codon:yes gene_type:complete